MTAVTENIVLLAAPVVYDVAGLRNVADEFGWELAEVRDLSEAVALQAEKKTVAILFHPSALGQYSSWVDALARLRKAFPDAHLIACHRLSEPIDWAELSQAGAFESLAVPFQPTEVRQALGFVWEAERRLWDAAGSLAAAPRRRPNTVHHVNFSSRRGIRPGG